MKGATTSEHRRAATDTPAQHVASEGAASTRPLVSVVMPVRDAAPYIAEAIASVLDQTMPDLELLVLDDGSTDDTAAIVREIAAADARVQVIACGRIGLVPALNLGFRLAKGEFVARMDADDVCDQYRFVRQVAYLRVHPDVAVVGTAYRQVYVDGRQSRRRRAEHGPERLRASMFFGNPVAHPTVMFVPSRLPEPIRYSASHPGAEDYELWLRLADGSRLDNMSARLLDYRIHEGGVSTSRPDIGRASAVTALADAMPWWRPLARWIAGGTYNAVQAGVGPLRFGAAVAALNVANAVRPSVDRRTLLSRSLIAVASYARRRW